MNQGAQLFVGQHDFSGFMSAGSSVEDCRRTVKSAEVRQYGERIVYRVEADGFLYNMVRIMAGSLLDVAHGRKSIEDIREALEEGKRTSAGFTAPPDGLYLCDVHYGQEIQWMCR
jgi:tRNA pseudouridine38-40 synthase